jgi:thiamine pyrophosphokinase
MSKRLGIVFAGGEGPRPEKTQRLFTGPAKGALIAAADSGLLAAEAAGLRPEWIVGDMDSLDDEGRLKAYPAQSVIRYGVDKDYTDTELAFSLLREKGCEDIWILGGGGGRTDHLFGIRSLFERDAFPVRWITATEDIYCVNAPEEFSSDLEAGALVSVFPLGPGPWKALSRGLKWPLDSLLWPRGFFGLSNAAVEGNFSIKTEQGRFMIIIPCPGDV